MSSYLHFNSRPSTDHTGLKPTPQSHSETNIAGYTFDELTWHFLRLSLTSKFNRLIDDLAVVSNGHLRQLHHKIRRHIVAGRSWQGYDYGHGYLYQSYRDLKLSGRRNTEDRIASMSLIERTRSKSVLDIGCNTGFISLAVARMASTVTGFDVNPHVINIANDCAHYLGMSNARFLVSSFTEFPEFEKFDVVMSLSNHITFDGPVFSTFDGYIAKCSRLLKKRGILVFESHTKMFEVKERSLEHLRSQLNNHFVELLQFTSSTGTSLDKDRLIYVGRLQSA